MIIIVFVQSGLDKIFDWTGNLSWLQSHFQKTFLAKSIGILLFLITVLEIVTGLMALVAVFNLIFYNDSLFAFYAAFIASITLLLLLLGQRIAKDYDGAKNLVVYLIATCFLMYLAQ